MLHLTKYNTTILLVIIIGVVLTRFLWGRFRKTKIIVRSMAFAKPEVPPVTVGNLNVNVPNAGNGLYVIGIVRTGSSVDVKTLYVGVLTPSVLTNRLNRMNKFYDDCVASGMKTIVVFSVGTTHHKPSLEELRIGIASGSMPEAASTLQKYGMKRFLSLEHGCRQPYILINDLNTKTTLREMTSYCGGNLYATVVT